jgi:hypothetical protein
LDSPTDLTSYEKEYITAQISQASYDNKRSWGSSLHKWSRLPNTEKITRAAEQFYSQPNIDKALTDFTAKVRKNGLTKAMDQLLPSTTGSTKVAKSQELSKDIQALVNDSKQPAPKKRRTDHTPLTIRHDPPRLRS